MIGVVNFGYGSGVIFGHITVHNYTVLYFRPCYRVKLEQIYRYGLVHIRLSVLCDKGLKEHLCVSGYGRQ